jgi:NAD(P)H dehydrogenase (quinone)
MARVIIVYATDYGSTKKMAEAVAEGVNSVDGAEAVLKMAEETKINDLLAADALIFGSPVHMGSMDYRMKMLIDKVCSGLWMKDALTGKVGAVFTTGSGFGNSGGGAELTQLSMLSNFAELGLLLIPLPKNTPGYAKAGSQWGPHGRSADENLKPKGLNDDQLVAARHHGANVATVALKLGGPLAFAK